MKPSVVYSIVKKHLLKELNSPVSFHNKAGFIQTIYMSGYNNYSSF